METNLSCLLQQEFPASCPISSVSVEVVVVSDGELSAVCEPWWWRPRCSKFLWCSTPFRDRSASVGTHEVAVSQKIYVETSLGQKAYLVFRSWYLHRSFVHFGCSTVKEEINRYSSQYSARLNTPPNGLVVNLMAQPGKNKRLQRHLPNNLPTRFLV
jgi:hypothetical protein